MMRWGSVDFSQLKNLQKQLESLDGKVICEAALNEGAGRLLAKVRKRTPVDTGNLRRNWRIGKLRSAAGEPEVNINNHTKYADYVEYGHRQTPGRFVPAIRKRLKKSWVPGRFMLTKSMAEMEGQLEKIVERRLMEALRKGGGIN
ncbi:MAG: HK97 gp10 family phage protein [Clostridiales bacterium]|nr:HK97 gp10 family phage protein [Clostridiales bacterium]